MDARHAALGVGDYFGEEVGEAGAAELGGACAVEVSVVDCFAVGWGAEAGAGGSGGVGPGGVLLLLGGGLESCGRSREEVEGGAGVG